MNQNLDRLLARIDENLPGNPQLGLIIRSSQQPFIVLTMEHAMKIAQVFRRGKNIYIEIGSVLRFENPDVAEYFFNMLTVECKTCDVRGFLFNGISSLTKKLFLYLMEALVNWNSLTTFSFNYNQLQRDSLILLIQCLPPQIEILQLVNLQLTDRHLELLHSKRNLIHLSIAYNHLITNDGLKLFLARIPHYNNRILSLDLSSLNSLNDGTFQVFCATAKNLTGLSHLFLNHHVITDENKIELLLDSVKDREMDNLHLIANQLTDTSLDYFLYQFEHSADFKVKDLNLNLNSFTYEGLIRFLEQTKKVSNKLMDSFIIKQSTEATKEELESVQRYFNYLKKDMEVLLVILIGSEKSVQSKLRMLPNEIFPQLKDFLFTN